MSGYFTYVVRYETAEKKRRQFLMTAINIKNARDRAKQITDHHGDRLISVSRKKN